jgi:hypothetical protein
MLRRLIDWFSGYTPADVKTLTDKMSAPKRPGGIIPLTAGELRALKAGAYAERNGQWIVPKNTKQA